MGYALAGWVEFVVEVQYIVDDPDDFHRFIAALQKHPLLTTESTSIGTDTLGAMVEGQTTNGQYVRYRGPAAAVAEAMTFLREACAAAFPRHH